MTSTFTDMTREVVETPEALQAADPAPITSRKAAAKLIGREAGVSAKQGRKWLDAFCTLLDQAQYEDGQLVAHIPWYPTSRGVLKTQPEINEFHRIYDSVMEPGTASTPGSAHAAVEGVVTKEDGGDQVVTLEHGTSDRHVQGDNCVAVACKKSFG